MPIWHPLIGITVWSKFSKMILVDVFVRYIHITEQNWMYDWNWLNAFSHVLNCIFCQFWLISNCHILLPCFDKHEGCKAKFIVLFFYWLSTTIWERYYLQSTLDLSKTLIKDNSLEILMPKRFTFQGQIICIDEFACRIRQVQESGKTFQETNKSATCLFGTLE